MTPEEMVAAAIAIAEQGLAAGEMPIGAIVEMGGQVIGRAFTQDRALGRRLVHADLLAMIEADTSLGWRARGQSVRLAVNLEPCLMCFGAAMAMRVTDIFYGLESPADGASAVAGSWPPTSADLPWYTAPRMVGGIRREQVRDQFRRYCAGAPESGFRRWAHTLAALPD